MTDAPEYCGPHTTQEALDETDRRLLDIIQTAFPLTPRPYADLGTLLGIPEEEALERAACASGASSAAWVPTSSPTSWDSSPPSARPRCPMTRWTTSYTK